MTRTKKHHQVSRYRIENSDSKNFKPPTCPNRSRRIHTRRPPPAYPHLTYNQIRKTGRAIESEETRTCTLSKTTAARNGLRPRVHSQRQHRTLLTEPYNSHSQRRIKIMCLGLTQSDTLWLIREALGKKTIVLNNSVSYIP